MRKLPRVVFLQQLELEDLYLNDNPTFRMFNLWIKGFNDGLLTDSLYRLAKRSYGDRWSEFIIKPHK